MRFLYASLALCTAAFADLPSQYCGDWLMVNAPVAVHVASDGTMSLLNNGETGKLILNKDESFVWEKPSHSQSGRFAEGKLFLKNDQPGGSVWPEFYEFRRGDKKDVAQMLESTRRQTQFLHRAVIQKSIQNNLRQLDAACSQFFLEKGATQVALSDLIGEGKYLKKLPLVDGEDYTILDLTQGAAWKVTTKSGVIVEYPRH
ncbi:MAG: hypothetical protein WC205_02390 [Opitutaceae bacterium]|jgi:hypothetical protein